MLSTVCIIRLLSIYSMKERKRRRKAWAMRMVEGGSGEGGGDLDVLGWRLGQRAKVAESDDAGGEEYRICRLKRRIGGVEGEEAQWRVGLVMVS